MIFAPEGAWLKIAEKNPHFLFVLFVSMLPLLLLSLGAEAYGLMTLGEVMTEMGRPRIAQELAIKYAFAHLVLDLAFLIFGSWFLMALAHSFNSPNTYSQAFSTLAYGASPLFLMHALDAFPVVYTWLAWGIGFGLSIRALYHGIAVNLKPEQTKGFGLFILSIFIVGFLGALSHYVALAVLHEKLLK